MLQAYDGGAASGYSVLLIMPMIWFGLQATDRELIAGAVVLALCSYLPMLVFGPPAYPVEWGHATLLVMVGADELPLARSAAKPGNHRPPPPGGRDRRRLPPAC